MKNKWWFFLTLCLGANVAGQALHYFIGGESQQSSSLRDFLVILQFFIGLAVAVYCWKKFSVLNRTRV